MDDSKRETCGLLLRTSDKNSKFETRSTKQIQNSNVTMFKTFGFQILEFVSDFEFRNSDLLLWYFQKRDLIHHLL